MNQLLQSEIEEFASRNAALIRANWGVAGKSITTLIKCAAGIDDESSAEGFNRFWNEYPSGKRKVDRKGCFRIWAREGLDDEIEAILSGLRRDKAHLDWTKSNGSFIPMPSVWLNQRRWDVEEQTNEIFAGAR